MAVQDGYDFGIEISSCVQAEVDFACRNLRNRVNSEGSIGYGVQDMASYQSRVAIRGVDMRHAYTSNTPTSTTNDEPYMYGQTMGAVVTGSVFGSSAASFDAHSEGVDITFVDCTTGGARFGEDSSGGAGGLRGTRTRFVNPVSRGDANGWQFFAQSAGDSVDCELINASYIGAGQPIRIGEFEAAYSITRPKVRGGFIRTSHATIAGVVAYNCTGGVIEDLLIAPTSATNGCTAIILGADAQLVVRRLVVDLSGYTGTQFRVASGLAGSSLVLERPRVINASGKLQCWFNGVSTNASIELLDHRSDAAPSSGDIINGGSLTAQTILGAMKPRSFAVASLPSAAAEGEGTIVWTTNGNTGAACPAISNGTDWKRIALGATVAAS